MYFMDLLCLVSKVLSKYSMMFMVCSNSLDRFMKERKINNPVKNVKYKNIKIIHFLIHNADEER